MSQVLPDKFYEHLNEHTLGYALFYIDDQGSPQIQIKADSQIDRIGLDGQIRRYADAIDTIYSDNMIQSILATMGEGGDSSEDGEDGEETT